MGHDLEMMKKRETLFKRGYREHDDVFAIKLGPRFAAVELKLKVPPGTELTQEVINQLEHIAWAIEETTRMRPSADLQLHTVEQALDLGGYHLPTGWQVHILSISLKIRSGAIVVPSPEYRSGRSCQLSMV